MSFKSFLLAGTSVAAVNAALAPLTAEQMANALAWAYGGLGLNHLNSQAGIV